MAIELVSRLLRICTALATMSGRAGVRSVRLRVLILRRANGEALATPDQVMPAIEQAQEFLRQAANLRLRPSGGVFILTVDEFGACIPARALRMRAGGEALGDYLGAPGDFLDRMIRSYHPQAAFPRTLPTTPVTCFIVEDLGLLRGVAMPVLGNWFAVPAHGLAPVDGLPPSIMAHEIGHCLGLYAHRRDPKNLMHAPDRRGARLTRWQRAVARSGRCVSFW